MMELEQDRARDEGLRHVVRFMEKLTVIPLPEWNEIAVAGRDRVADASEQALADALRDPGIAWDVWSARDDVETVMCRFDSVEGRVYIARTGSRAHIRLVTERAALAVLVRTTLGASHFIICYGGFERVIPAATL